MIESQSKGSSLQETEQVIQIPKIGLEELIFQSQLMRLSLQANVNSVEVIWKKKSEDIISFFQNYQTLPHSPIKMNELFVAGAKISRNERKIFFGYLKGKNRKGKGIMLYKNGRIYEGQFFQGEKCGEGCQIDSMFNYYIGSYSQHKRHGKGSMFWFKQKKIDECYSQGKITQQYQGEWWGGLPDGKGKFQKQNGDFYIGNFVNGLKHGQGKEFYHNGDKYEGEYINGLAEGFGQYFWKDGSSYMGDFKQGFRNGYGTWKSSENKQMYKGNYLLDKKHGLGIYRWETGEVYKGMYIEDQRNGYGELLIGETSIFQGQWKDGEKVQKYQQAATRQITKRDIVESVFEENKLSERVITSQKKQKSISASIKKNLSEERQFMCKVNEERIEQQKREKQKLQRELQLEKQKLEKQMRDQRQKQEQQKQEKIRIEQIQNAKRVQKQVRQKIIREMKEEQSKKYINKLQSEKAELEMKLKEEIELKQNEKNKYIEQLQRQKNELTKKLLEKSKELKQKYEKMNEEEELNDDENDLQLFEQIKKNGKKKGSGIRVKLQNSKSQNLQKGRCPSVNDIRHHIHSKKNSSSTNFSSRGRCTACSMKKPKD